MKNKRKKLFWFCSNKILKITSLVELMKRKKRCKEKRRKRKKTKERNRKNSKRQSKERQDWAGIWKVIQKQRKIDENRENQGNKRKVTWFQGV